MKLQPGWLLLGITAALAFAVWLLPPIAQPQSYHDFADQRTLLGIPHAWNVLSNLPLAGVGATGCWWLGQAAHRQRVGRFCWHYQLFFAATVLTAAGSIHYHLAPGNDTLFWDRMGIALAMMALLSALIGELISALLGRLLLLPALLLGTFSVIYWAWSERAGAGDLRLYILLQTLALLLPLLMVLLCTWPWPGRKALALALGSYLLAKGSEYLDPQIFSWSDALISGHSLKHAWAAVAVYCLLRMLRQRHSRPARAGAD